MQKKIEEKNRMGKTRDLFKKIRDTEGTFSCKDGLSKGQKWYGPNKSRIEREMQWGSKVKESSVLQNISKGMSSLEKMSAFRRKGKIYPFECRVPKNSKER